MKKSGVYEVIKSMAVGIGMSTYKKLVQLILNYSLLCIYTGCPEAM